MSNFLSKPAAQKQHFFTLISQKTVPSPRGGGLGRGCERLICALLKMTQSLASGSRRSQAFALSSPPSPALSGTLPHRGWELLTGARA